MKINAENLANIQQIVRDTDPRAKIMEIIQKLHEDLAEIQKQIEKAKLEEKMKLRKVEAKIREAVQALQTHKTETALAVLQSIKGLDPLVYSQLKPEVQKLQEIADELHKLRMQAITVFSNGILV